MNYKKKVIKTFDFSLCYLNLHFRRIQSVIYLTQSFASYTYDYCHLKIVIITIIIKN